MHLVFLISFVLVGQVVCSDALRGERKLVRARIESLENALIMKYIQDKVAQIQGKLNILKSYVPQLCVYTCIYSEKHYCSYTTTLFTVVEFCNPDRLRDNEYALMEPQINSLTNKKNKRTFIYVPYQFTANGKELYVGSGGEVSGEEHAEDIMFTALNEVPPLEYWINNSPCPCCAVNLISRYSAAGIPDDKPKTIKFIYFYTLPPHFFINPNEEGKGDGDPQEMPEQATMLSLQCMAKMIHHGFRFQPWDWSEFRDNLASESCRNTLDNALNKEETANRLIQASQRAVEAIKNASALAEASPENELCTLNQLQPLVDSGQCRLWNKLQPL